ncbi:hypothetical protein EPH_0029910 [Eimeria praecox]|uniref:Uncharacterized protein n=1 Tax=Eimeria praecox TaxID=51316 RepID=U6G0Z2_9EIME|nr:hypothetical protein EPH_0029910 [Eimeria praecox]
MMARVLFIGMSAINVEVSKDLALAGVSQTLCDDRIWREEEMCFNFLPSLAAEIEAKSTGLIVSQCCGSIGFFVQDFGDYEIIKKDSNEKIRFSHPPLPDVLTAKLAELDPKVNPAVFAVLALLRWEAETGVQHRGFDDFDEDAAAAAAATEAAAAAAEAAAAAKAAATAAEIERAAEKLFAAEGVKLTPQILCATRQLAEALNKQINTIAAIVGGLISRSNTRTVEGLGSRHKKYRS